MRNGRITCDIATRQIQFVEVYEMHFFSNAAKAGLIIMLILVLQNWNLLCYSTLRKEPDTMKGISRFLSVFLVLALILSCSACSSGTFTAPGEEDVEELIIGGDNMPELFIPLTEKTSKSLVFTLSDEQADQVRKAGAGKVTWTLHRNAPYANPADGKFIPLHGEEKMFPNEKETIDFATISFSNANESGEPFSMKSFKTKLEDSTLKLNFTTTPVNSGTNDSIPHESGGRFLDICGEFTLTAELDGVTLASLDHVTIKPYASFHTMWEMFDELQRLAEEGDDDGTTSTPYVEYGVMGKSCLGYDMPYLIVARDSASVQKWLELSERAEETGTAVMEELQNSGDEDYQVPVLYSNVHANEVAAADGILEFARQLIEEPSVEYTKLTGFTEEGKAKLEQQRKELRLQTPKLIADKCNYLGSIWPNKMMDSGVVDGFDSYYTSEKTTVNVSDLLGDVFFILVPEENVDARMHYTRNSANGYNLNRDNSFQVTPETQNMQHLIGSYDPVTFLELHGVLEPFQIEPATPPHQPNFEYDVIARTQMAGGEAFGAAAVANNPLYQSYVLEMRDYMQCDKDGTLSWSVGGNDYPTIFTPTYAMLHGCVGYTAELPAYSETTRVAATYGLWGLADYVAANKESYFANLAEIYERGIANKNSDAEVGPWFVDGQDNTGAEADIFRPAHTGEGENGQFFPECYLIPLDAENQSNLQAAFEMIEYLTRNDVKVSIAGSPVTADGKTLPSGTAVISMYQAKRSVANAALFSEPLLKTWDSLSNGANGSFNYIRGFDMVTCVKPAEYDAIAGALGQTITYDTLQPFLQEKAVSQFTGVEGGDVIISNASESSTAAVNTLLGSGKQVGMITEGTYKGDFICSYEDWQSVSADHILTGTGVKDPDITAYVIEKTPTVYISGTQEALTPAHEGYVYNRLVTLSTDYNNERIAMELMGFGTTENIAGADAVVGGAALDEESIAAVQTGVPYVGYTGNAVETIQESILPDLQTGSADGVDCLGYVTYPAETLVNASYIKNGDDVFYSVGTDYFTALPEGSRILVQRDGSRAPLEGIFHGEDESTKAFLNGIMGFSYEGKDKDGKDVNITLFANSMTESGHQRDEYAFISNALFSAFLTETRY